MQNRRLSSQMTTSTERIHSVDILRGLLALGVMFYHYSYYIGFEIPQPLLSFLYKTGIYAVEGFFVLSGFSLYWAYRDRPPFDGASYLIFLTNRMLRLAPLFAAALLLQVYIFVRIDPANIPSIGRFLANLTLTFGFYDMSMSSLTGGWSIAVEVVLSVIFPVLLLLQIKLQRRFVIVIAALAILLFFWQGKENYVAPPNHIMFFAGGVFIGYLRKEGYQISPFVFWTSLFAASVSYVWINSDISDYGALLEGLPRITFSTITLALASIFCWSDFRFSRNGVMPLIWLGEASYSIYLLHPLIFQLQRMYFSYLSNYAALITCVTATLLLSWFTYRFFEKPLMSFKLGIRQTRYG